MIPESKLHRTPQVVAPGIRRVVTFRYGSMLWTVAKMRKAHSCGLCGVDIGLKAWRPITFGDWRMVRICLRCWPNDGQ